ACACEDEFLREREFLASPEFLVHLPDPFRVHDADLSLRFGGQTRNVFLGIHVDSADEDAVDRFEALERSTPHCTAPDGVSRLNILPRRESQCDIEGDACCGKFLEGRAATGCVRNLDHPVAMALTPFQTQLNVALRSFSKLALGLSAALDISPRQWGFFEQ